MNYRVRETDPVAYDQFFTKEAVVAECLAQLSGIMFTKFGHYISDFDLIVEPAFGMGAFVRGLASYRVPETKLLGIDIDAVDTCLRKDFLADFPKDFPLVETYLHSNGPPRKRLCLTVGNPPFGTKSTLALKFINHAAKYSDVVAFILPSSFRKQSVRNKIDKYFCMITQIILTPESFILQGKTYKASTVFQVWLRPSALLQIADDPVLHDILPGMTHKQQPRMAETPDFVCVNRDQSPDVVVRRVGVYAGRLYTDSPTNYSTASHIFLKFKSAASHKRILRRLRHLDLENTPCKYHTVGFPSLSKTELCLLYMRYLRKHCK